MKILSICRTPLGNPDEEYSHRYEFETSFVLRRLELSFVFSEFTVIALCFVGFYSLRSAVIAPLPGLLDGCYPVKLSPILHLAINSGTLASILCILGVTEAAGQCM